MKFSPDQYIVWTNGTIDITATLLYSWIVMFIIISAVFLLKRRITSEKRITQLQNFFEVMVYGIRGQMLEMGGSKVIRLVPFVGTLFIYILVSNLISVFPYVMSPTASMSTTFALASLVFLAVPYFSITKCGLLGYIKHFMDPTPVMLPLNVVSEISGSLALAIRLYGNMMSGTVIGLVLLGIAPFFFPVLMQLLGLITAVIQAYIFSVLALVYISAGDVE